MPIFGLHRPHPVLAPVRPMPCTAERASKICPSPPKVLPCKYRQWPWSPRGFWRTDLRITRCSRKPRWSMLASSSLPASHHCHLPTPVPALPISSKSEDGKPTEQTVSFLTHWEANSWCSVTTPWLWSPVTSLHSTQNFPHMVVYGNCSHHRTLTLNTV